MHPKNSILPGKDGRHLKTTLANSVLKPLHPPRRKYLSCLCFLIEKGSRAGGMPNSQTQHQPLQVRLKRNFQMDIGEECIPEETKMVVNDKKDQEKLQDFTWSPCRPRNMNAIPKKDSNRATPADAECRSRHDPPAHEGLCAGKESKQQTPSSFWPLANGTRLLFEEGGVLYFGRICRNPMEKHDATWRRSNPQRKPAHARSGTTNAARISRRLPGWLPGKNQCGCINVEISVA